MPVDPNDPMLQVALATAGRTASPNTMTPAPGQPPPQAVAPPPPDSQGTSETPSFTDYLLKQMLPGVAGTALAGLFGGSDAAAGFSQGYSKASNSQTLQQREADFMQEQRSVKRAEEIVDMWDGISLTEEEWRSYGIEPRVVQDMQDLSQKWHEAQLESSDRGSKISVKEANEINRMAGMLEPEFAKIRAASARVQEGRDISSRGAATTDANIAAINALTGAGMRQNVTIPGPVGGTYNLPNEAAAGIASTALRGQMSGENRLAAIQAGIRGRSLQSLLDEQATLAQQIDALRRQGMVMGGNFEGMSDIQGLQQRMQAIQMEIARLQQSGGMTPPPISGRLSGIGGPGPVTSPGPSVDEEADAVRKGLSALSTGPSGY